MHIRRIVSRLLLALALFVAVTVDAHPPTVLAQGGNLLQNPGFDGPYTAFNGDRSKLVAAGWSAWNVARKSSDPGFFLVPQYRLGEDKARSVSNGTAQEFFEFFASFSGGVFQRVAVAPGAKLRFTTRINVWSTSLDDPSRSDEPSRATLEVGIDPTGGVDGESRAIVWKGVTAVYDESRPISVDATASGAFVTVFVKVSLADPVQHNHAYVDDAVLELTSNIQPTVAGATNAPLPTNTLVALPTAVPDGNATAIPANTLPPLVTLDPSIPTREILATAVPTITPGGPTLTPTETATLRPPPGSTATPVLRVFGTVAPELRERIFVTVKAGDTIVELAQQYGSTVDAIVNANGLNNAGLISIGQQLLIPVSNLPAGTPTFTAAPPTAIPTLVPGQPTFAPTFDLTPPVLTAFLNGPTNDGIGTYIVKPGDTFEAIARRYNVTVQTLAALNGITNPQGIVIGQVLAVPGAGNNTLGGTVAPTIIPTRPGQPGANPNSGKTHVVQAGENLFRIALRYGVSVDALARANGIGNSSLVFVGQSLRIP